MVSWMRPIVAVRRDVISVARLTVNLEWEVGVATERTSKTKAYYNMQ